MLSDVQYFHGNVCCVHSVNVKWAAGVVAVVVGVVILCVAYKRYKVIKRRRQIAYYENMGNCAMQRTITERRQFDV